DMCTESLKQQLNPRRDELKAEKDARLEKKKNKQDWLALEGPERGYTNCLLQSHIREVMRKEGIMSRGLRRRRFDDSEVTPRTDEDIKKLSGGGEWHMAYFTFFREVDELLEE
ncbi:MAG: hypothetical protein EZS28_029259, partial [Streblomastix strix]